MIRRLAVRSLIFLTVVAALGLPARAADAEPTKEPDKAAAEPAATDCAALEKQFEETLSGATLSGNYTSGQKDTSNLKEDKYTILKVSKLQGDIWLFNVRIQYGGHDATVPLPLKVLWAGNTPVITLDKMPIPGMGAFSARVLFYEGKYAGTWSGANHGGHLFGKVTKETPTAEGAGK